MNKEKEADLRLIFLEAGNVICSEEPQYPFCITNKEIESENLFNEEKGKYKLHEQRKIAYLEKKVNNFFQKADACKLIS